MCGTWSALLLKDTLQVSHFMFNETSFYKYNMEYHVTKRSIIMTYCTLTKEMLTRQHEQGDSIFAMMHIILSSYGMNHVRNFLVHSLRKMTKGH